MDDANSPIALSVCLSVTLCIVTLNSLKCADLSVRAILRITFAPGAFASNLTIVPAQKDLVHYGSWGVGKTQTAGWEVWGRRHTYLVVFIQLDTYPAIGAAPYCQILELGSAVGGGNLGKIVEIWNNVWCIVCILAHVSASVTFTRCILTQAKHFHSSPVHCLSV